MRDFRQVLFWLGLALALFVPGCLIYQQEAHGQSAICATRRLTFFVIPIPTEQQRYAAKELHPFEILILAHPASKGAGAKHLLAKVSFATKERL